MKITYTLRHILIFTTAMLLLTIGGLFMLSELDTFTPSAFVTAKLLGFLSIAISGALFKALESK